MKTGRNNNTVKFNVSNGQRVIDFRDILLQILFLQINTSIGTQTKQ